MKTRTIESQELENLGLSKAALSTYSNSDFDVYETENGYTVKIRSEIVFEDRTIEDVEALFTEDLDEE